MPGAGFYHVALTDGLSPAAKRWLEQMSPAALRGLRRIGGIVIRKARQNARTMLHQRTGIGLRGIRLKVDARAGNPRVIIWPSAAKGLGQRGRQAATMAAHELGSAIPAATIRPKSRHGAGIRGPALGWGGPPGGPHARFARVVHRPGFRLPRRPWLSSALQETQGQFVPAIEAMYQAMLEKASALR